jgi:hypothetical protein
MKDFEVYETPVQVTDEDRERLDRMQNDQHSPEMLVAVIDTHAMLEINSVEGRESRRWKLTAHLAVRAREKEEMLEVAWNVHAVAPYVDYTVDQANDHWRTIVAEAFAAKMIAVVEGDDHDE